MQHPKIKIYRPKREEYSQIREMFSLMEKESLHTICHEALCPNRFECFSHGVATFLLLGNTCTRNCGFCYVGKNKEPEKIDPNEPKKVAKAIKKLNLSYAVITCVTRDDLSDGGAEVFSKTVKEIRKENPKCKIELLISDLKGNWNALGKIVKSEPDVLGHNIDTVESLFPKIKPLGNYQLSLKLLKKIKEFDAEMKTKSGLMLGLGEEKKEVIQTMGDLRDAKVDFLTLGQYLQPSEKHREVKKFYSHLEFKDLKRIGYKKFDFEDVASSPLVRSSYRADKLIK